MTTRVGTPQYVAPEVVNNRIHGYSSKCDIWSIGVALWYVSIGELPFVGRTPEAVLKQVVSGSTKFKTQLWQELHGHTQELQDLIADLLVRDSEQRPSAKLVLASNKWLSEHGDRTMGQKSCCTIS